jgi:hypothetical protein
MLGGVGAGPPHAPVPEGGNADITALEKLGLNRQQVPQNYRFQTQNNFSNNGAALQNNRLSFEELQQRRQEQRAAKDQAKKAGAAITGFNFKEGIASVATAEEIGDYYQYVIDQRISVARQKSAMLPIVDEAISGEKVSIYNEAIQAKYPLLGLRLKNTSGKPLTQGPITVYDEGTYAGDTRILDLQPGEERLLSYALDQGTEIKTDVKDMPSPDMHFRVAEDKLTARYHLRETKSYTIRNRSPHDRLVVLEHPVRSGWKLIEPTKPEETRDVYRFQVKVPSGKTVTFDVAEDQARVDLVALVTKDAPFYPVVAGINVKVDKQHTSDELVGLKIRKGLVLSTVKTRDSRTYLVQNLSPQDRTFTVDHLIPAGWVRLDDKDGPQRGPDVFRFKLTVAKSKTGQQEVVQEHKIEQPGKALKDLSEEKSREYLASKAVAADVKAALEKNLALQARITETKKQLAEAEKQLKALSDDQSRLRENLRIIPQTSDPYKRFLDKFVTQESEIDGLQREVRQSTATLQAQEREYAMFLSNLNVE